MGYYSIVVWCPAQDFYLKTKIFWQSRTWLLIIISLVAEPQNLGKSAKSSEIHKNIQNAVKFDRFLAKFAQRIPTKSPFFYQMIFWRSQPQKFPQNTHKIGCFFSKSVSENPAKFDVFFPTTYQKPCQEQKKNEQLALFHFRIVFLCHGCVIVLCDPMLLDTFFSVSELRGLPC